MTSRFHQVNLLDLSEVEREIDTLISLAGDNPSDSLIEEVTMLVKVAKSLGTTRFW